MPMNRINQMAQRAKWTRKVKTLEEKLRILWDQLDTEIHQTDVEWLHLKHIVKSTRPTDDQTDTKSFNESKSSSKQVDEQDPSTSVPEKCTVEQFTGELNLSQEYVLHSDFEEYDSDVDIDELL